MFIQPPNELDAKFPAAPCSRDRNARYPQSYTLPHTRVKPGFGRLKSAIAAAAGEEKCGVGFGVRLERIGISKAHSKHLGM